jgi:hypothetical protein
VRAIADIMGPSSRSRSVRVANLQSRLVGGQREVSAEVTFERPTFDRFPIWFRNPDAGEPTAAGDPYLPVLLVSAMALHEDLRIEAPVSAPLLEAARERIAPLPARRVSR